MENFTKLLNAAEQGDPNAADQLLPLVYGELRRLAAYQMEHEKPGQTLQPTALVHEAWLRLAGSAQVWSGRRHFFAAAAEAMRRILIDRARGKVRIRHGGGLERVDLKHVEIAFETHPEVLLPVDEALAKLAIENQVAAELVKLRFFIGLTINEAAQTLNISEKTADRLWAYARVWLYNELKAKS